MEKYEESLSIYRRLYEVQGTPEGEKDYSISCYNVVRIYEKQGRLAEALEKYEEDFAILQKLGVVKLNV